jgi:hypothetical protein
LLQKVKEKEIARSWRVKRGGGGWVGDVADQERESMSTRIRWCGAGGQGFLLLQQLDRENAQPAAQHARPEMPMGSKPYLSSSFC